MPTTTEPPFRASRYTTGAILLHWTIALLVALQLIGGYAMARLLDDGSRLQFLTFQLHKSIGITVLVLTLARILWRAFNPPPAYPPSLAGWQRRLARALHLTFYALLLLIPLAGWLVVTLSPVEIETVLFFSERLPWPDLPGFAFLSDAARTALATTMTDVHAVLAYGALALIALHVAAALRHHRADGGFLARMAFPGGDGPRNAYGHATTVVLTLAFAAAMVASAGLARREAIVAAGVSPDQPALLGSGAAVAPEAAPVLGGRRGSEPAAAAPATLEPPAAPAAPAADEAVPRWAVRAADSSLGFTARLGDRPTPGRFARWSADIRFDPADLPASSIEVTIDTTSVSLDSADLSQRDLEGIDGFDNVRNGTARFRADTIRTEGDGYVAEGELTIRGVTRPVRLPFTLAIDGATATARGEAVIDRTAFRIGTFNDAEGDVVGHDVTVSFALVADRVGADAGPPRPDGPPADRVR